ncbi:MAG: type I restriction-modification system subunit M [Candidatus Muirbacterium halophilum]|nr:type I restriction-modification system subunit M [Candidatus Muirbacterium halophilum]MCK9476667.1 type I restriction-modification system subunit M [Candidatus Muirbacterium halophilum]
MKTNQDTINKIIWKACDTFRGTMNSSAYMDYILTMLFVKYLSDFYKEKVEVLTEKYQGNQKKIKKSLQNEKFILNDYCTFDYLFKNKETTNIGETINVALAKIEEDNKIKLEGVFRNIDFNNSKVLGNTKERNSILKHLLEDFNDKELDLRPSKLASNDVIGDSYEYLISNFASDAGKKGGEFFTPANVSTLLAKLVEAKKGDRIYDPACGSGSLLIKAAREIGSHEFQIYGQEKNGQTHSLALMNMFLHNINDAKIAWGDTLRNPLHKENDMLATFDTVVANPPFSLDKWGQEELTDDKFGRFDMGIPPKSKGDYAFILHMLASANPEGTVGVILPHGVLFRGASEGKIRTQIIQKYNYLHAVIGLPANLFFGTSIPACILIFKKNRKTQDVLFIDASSEFEKVKNQNVLRDIDVQKILHTYKEREVINKYSYIATRQEIEENDYNLNIPRYVDTFEEEEPIDMPKVKENINKIETELESIKHEMNKYLDELGL